MEENGGGPRGLWSIRRNLQGPSIAPRTSCRGGFPVLRYRPEAIKYRWFCGGFAGILGPGGLESVKKSHQVAACAATGLWPVLSDRKPAG